MTSPRDRLLHYGLSLQDMDALRNSASAHDYQLKDWKFLSRFWQEYKDQLIVQSEVRDLHAELLRLRTDSDDPAVNHACDILLSISSSVKPSAANLITSMDEDTSRSRSSCYC
jgi:hypothetical protein